MTPDVEPWASSLILHCLSSLSCMNQYIAIDSGGYVYTNNPRAWVFPREIETLFAGTGVPGNNVSSAL